MADDDIARASVLSVLGGGFIQQMVSFSMFDVTIAGADYLRARDAISRGEKRVKYDSSRDSGAGLYDPESNVLTLGFTSPAHILHEALIVHECTHMICDIRALGSLNTGRSECLAYVAQMLYIRTRQEAFPNIDRTPIFNRAWNIANEIRAGHGETWRWFWGTSNGSLLEAVRGNRKYAAKINNVVGYNG